jgi:glycosyltransferase involved in cell wall biosynthesis
MRVAFIGQKGIPATFGGVEYHVDELSRGMVRLGHEVDVYIRNWYTKKNLKDYQGVKLIHVPTIKSKHLDASVHCLLSTLVAFFKEYDVIHYHGIGPSFFSFIPKIWGKHVVSTVHRLDWQTEKWGKLAKTCLKWGEFISVRIPDKTIVVSEDLRKYILDKYKKSAILIRHGINLSPKRPPKHISLTYDLKESQYILFMGRLSPEKRVEWLIQAYKNLKKSIRMQNIKLVIAGETSATDGYTRSLKEMSGDDIDIIFPGYVTGIIKEELLSNALVFVLPSYLEGFPIVLLEAMGYGMCCLASNISPHREAIRPGRTGMLFDSDRFSDLERKLDFLISNPESIVEIRQRSREEMAKRPEWDDVVKDVLEVYQEIR